MKRRTFLKGLGAFLAAPLAFFGAKKTAPVSIPAHPHLTDENAWFLEEPFDTKDKDFIYFSSKEPLNSLFVDDAGKITGMSWWNGQKWIPIEGSA